MSPAVVRRCAICPRTQSLQGVIVGERELLLCDEHHEQLGDAVPDNLAELTERVANEGLCRRAREDRREGERRMFPRPERRRLNSGRRATDVDG